MTDTAAPAWAAKGATVAEYLSRGPWGTKARLTTVERVTATQVITANGRRYRATGTASRWHGLPEVGSGHYELLPPDAPDVIKALTGTQLESVFRAVHALERDHSHHPQKRDPLDVIREIERLAAAARVEAERLRKGTAR